VPYENLLFDKQDQIGLITLNRPERLNALSRGLHLDTLAVLEEIRHDDDVRTVVITGAGRGFCSGADLQPPRGPDGQPLPRVTAPQTQEDLLDEFHWIGDQALAFHGLDKPVIAAMNGVCVGAGMSLALACDMRVGSEHARFKTVFLERNLSPDSGMSWFLPRIIGHSRAMDLILTSREVGADEAYRLGLLDRLVPHERLLDEAFEVAKQIMQWPPLATRAAKRVVQQNMNLRLDDALRNEIAHLGFSRKATNDAAESRASFLEKRPPKFTGT
jgi:2-(1,2-epoxy-1,2-dihydrophenyl)acetyl-CoA isomerase